MRILLDARCNGCDAVSELWVSRDEVATQTCPECGHRGMTRIASAPKLAYTAMAANGEASSDAMGTAIDKWAKMREKEKTRQQRNLERHGTYD